MEPFSIMLKNNFLGLLRKKILKMTPSLFREKIHFLSENIRVKATKSFFQIRSIIPYYLKAIYWIKNNSIPNQGVVISSKQKVPYLEVTGYLIPTLIDSGEFQLAKIYAEFLCKMQQKNGAFTGADGRDYVFDSAQALIAASEYWEKFKPFALKTLKYIVSSINENGEVYSIYNGKIPDAIHVFTLPVLVKAAEMFNEPEYQKLARKSVKYYKKIPNVLNINYLTHFLAYIIDGFIDMGESDFVYPIVKKIFSFQKKDGSIPAYPNVKWSCSTGVAQFAIIGYKLGFIECADKAIHYLCKIQNPSGGFYGSYGFQAHYFPLEEISWANKFFLDAIHLKITSHFNIHADIFPEKVSDTDGRLEAVLIHLGNLQNKKVLDVGCGKGRFAIQIKKRFPTCEIHGVDISKALLQNIPASIITKKGSILNLPYEDESFDGVFCIEVLEHALRTNRAISELCRVLKKGGRLVIIDKNVEKLGKLAIAEFEQWFDKQKILNILKKWCKETAVQEISYDQFEADGLFLAWTGIKK